MILGERLSSLRLRDLPGRGRLIDRAGVGAITTIQETAGTRVSALAGVLAEVGDLLACTTGPLELLVRSQVMVLGDQMWRLRLLGWGDPPSIRRGLVSVRLLHGARLLGVMLQLHRAQIARPGHFLVRLRAITLHLLYLCLHLRLCLRFVHALAD